MHLLLSRFLQAAPDGLRRRSQRNGDAGGGASSPRPPVDEDPHRNEVSFSPPKSQPEMHSCFFFSVANAIPQDARPALAQIRHGSQHSRGPLLGHHQVSPLGSFQVAHADYFSLQIFGRRRSQRSAGRSPSANGQAKAQLGRRASGGRAGRE